MSSTADGDAAVSQPEGGVRGERLFRAVDAVTTRVESTSRRLLPDAWNPLLHSGAVANTLLIIACITGALLLFWYSPSVHFAHQSMRAIEASLLSRLVRAVHRYSSDACLAFTLWHALRLTSARRFTGARWLAWVTGGLSVGLLWVVGWLGYWLVWDEPARQVALTTARVLDVLPIFADPMSREFIADATVNSLLFFIVFFIHMLLPMGMAVALWLHIARLARPDFLASRGVTAALVGVLVALALVVPPVAAAPARMAILPGAMTLDGWYLLPVWLADGVSGRSLMALLLGLSLVGLSLPWLLARKKQKPATIVVSRCNACEQCANDCPYDAITMVPRTDGRNFKTEARVDPSRCVSCGICSGSCSSGGSTLPHFDTLLERARLERWLDEEPEGARSRVAFLCHDAVPASLFVDEVTGRCEALPGYRVRWVPCAGWVQAITVERALRRGAPGVLIVGCAGACRFREGMEWTQQRFSGKRSVSLPNQELASRVRLVEGDRLDQGAVIAAARAFAAATPPASRRVFPLWAGATLAAVLSSGVLYAGSALPWSPARMSPRLAVAFKHPGAIEELCRTLSDAEKAKRPPHMRRDTECERRRQPVRLEVRVDGELAYAKAYPPHGLWGDGTSVALETLELPAGRHLVSVRIGDSADPNAWPFVSEKQLELREGELPAVVFDRTAGFAWYPETH